MKAIKKPSLFTVFIISLTICACENQMMAALLKTKTITFDSNGGSYVPPQTLMKNEKISEPQIPSKDDYFFNGWFTDNVFFYNRWDFNDIPEGNMTLYAGWDDNDQYGSDNLLNPHADDFEIEGFGEFVYDGEPKVVTVTAKPGKTGGKITVYYHWTISATVFAKSSEAPSEPGTYMLTFDVEKADGWNAAYEFNAGLLIIIPF